MLAQRVSGLAVSLDDLDLYRTDLFYELDFRPLAVAVPKDYGQVQAIVKAAPALGISLSVRGAGLSYSAGYIPANARTVVVDTTGMDRIVEINQPDRYVTVEAGTSWASLRDALEGTGLQPPFWGTFSGRHATIGASLSQGAKFYGSGYRGTSAETVIGLKVVTGNGDLVVTGSGAGILRPSPFYRNYGPDLTGIFLGDCGAFGIKVEATLQLVPAAATLDFASFSFQQPDALLRAMTAIGAEALASECFALDSNSVRGQLTSEGIGEDLKTLTSVVTAQTSRLKGVKEAISVVMAGRRFADKPGFLLNCVAEGRDGSEVRGRIRRIKEIVGAGGGTKIPSSIPRVMRGDPFPKMKGLLSRSGKRINWLHTVVPNSRAVECYERTEAVYEDHRGEMEALGISRGYLLSANGPSGVGLETLVHWSDEPLPVHRHYMSMSLGKPFATRPADPQARDAVRRISHEIIRCWAELGGVHLQIGRKYPYFETRQKATRDLAQALKAMLDPGGIINPGNLIPALSTDGNKTPNADTITD